MLILREIYSEPIPPSGVRGLYSDTIPPPGARRLFLNVGILKQSLIVM
jgi:hypothetical protein